MSMFSEFGAEMSAKHLEKLLLHAIAVGGEVKVFAKEYLYQWYLDECSDSWGLCEVNPMIKREFEEEEKKE